MSACRHDDLVIWTAEGEAIAVECRACGAPMTLAALLAVQDSEEVTEP